MKSICTLCAQFEIKGLRKSQGRPRVTDEAAKSIR
jgi:hypothetical protein